MRTSLLSLGAVGALAVAVAACGGGGGSRTTPAPPGTAAGQALAAPIKVVNFKGPGTRMTVSIKIPIKANSQQQAAANYRRLKKLGAKLKTDAKARVMANVSPSQQVRTAADAQRRYAFALEKGSGRSPAYVSPSTGYMEFVLADTSNNVLVDEAIVCDSYESSTCSGTFDAPIGTNYTASLYLYDYCTYLLSAGSTSVAQIFEGQDNPLTVDLSGVVSWLDLEFPSLPGDPNGYAGYLLGDPSQTTTVPVSVVPYDYDGNAIVGPYGTLLDTNLEPIATIAVSPASGSGIVETQFAISVPSPLPTGPDGYPAAGPFTWSPTPAPSGAYSNGSQATLEFDANPTVVGSPMPGSYIGYTPCCSSSGANYVSVYPRTLWWNAVFPSGGLGDPKIFNDGYIGSGYTAVLEFPAPIASPAQNGTPAPNYAVSLTEGFGHPEWNLPTLPPTANVSIHVYDSGTGCDNVLQNPFDLGVGDTTLPWTSSPIPSVTIGPVLGVVGSCQLYADDGVNQAYLDVYIDQTNLTIQGRARKLQSHR